jgi:hypothetical protein
MAQLSPITVTVSVSLGATALPVKPITFEVPLAAVEATSYADTAATYLVDLDRTELRDQLTRSVRTLADQVEGAFLAPGAIVLTCSKCDSQIIAKSPAVLRHEADGAHSITGPVILSNLPVKSGVAANVHFDPNAQTLTVTDVEADDEQIAP